ncbi:MAG: hypothetical protein VX777_07525 [Chlamydiota bacterium]|nr:hypothetical protein [Chlamydiota bacterium]
MTVSSGLIQTQCNFQVDNVDQIKKLLANIESDVSFFHKTIKTLLEDSEWLKANSSFGETLIEKIELVAAKGRLDPLIARVAYKTFNDSGFGEKLAKIDCSFANSKREIALNKFLLNATSEYSRGDEFINLQKFADHRLSLSSDDIDCLSLVEEWLVNKKISGLNCNLDSRTKKNLDKVFKFCSFYQMADLRSDVIKWAFDNISQNFIDLLEVGLESKIDEVKYFAIAKINDELNGIKFDFIGKNRVSLTYSRVKGKVAVTKEHIESIKKMLSIMASQRIDVFLKMRSAISAKELTFFHTILKNHSSVVKLFSVLFEGGASVKIHDQVSHIVNLMISKLSNITHLQLIGNGNEELTSDHVSTLLESSPPLVSIAIDNCTNASVEQFNSIVKRSADKLESVRYILSGKFDDSGVDCLKTHCPNLKSVFFDFGEENEDWDVTEQSVIDMVTMCRNVQSLRFYNSICAPNNIGYDHGIVSQLEELFHHSERRFLLNYYTDLPIYTKD